MRIFYKMIPHALVAGVALVGGLSQALPARAAVPDISDALRQQPPAQLPQQTPRPLPQGLETLDKIDAPVTPASPQAAAEDERIDVREFIIEGNKAVATSVLQDLLKAEQGRQLTLAEIEAAVARITGYYRKRGYFVARAYLPAQDVFEGRIRIRVVEGTYGSFHVENQSLISDELALEMVDGLRKPGIISSTELEQRILLLNEVPGVQVKRAELQAGAVPGTTDLALDLDSPAPFGGYVMGDNYGSVYTGKYRLSAGAEYLSPFGIGDKLSLSGLVTDGTDLQSYRVAYSLPLSSRGLRGEVAVSHTTYSLTDSFAPLDAVGNATTVEGTLTYPFRRLRALSVDGTLNVAYRDLVDEIRATGTETPKSTVSTTAGVSTTRINTVAGLPGRMTAGASATVGHLNIRDDAARALDAAGADTQGLYGKINFNVGQAVELKPRWTVSTGVRAQKALGRNLDSSEDMSIAGMGAVKAYPLDEYSAEDAVLANLELQYALPTKGDFRASLSAFTDVGFAAMENRFGPETSRFLSDVGIGLHMGYKNAFSSIHYAVRTSDEATSDNVSRGRLMFQVGTQF